MLGSPDAILLKRCRDALTHKSVRRLIGLHVGSTQGRSLAQIAELQRPGAQQAPLIGSIGDLIPRLLRFGEMEYLACCEAIKDDYGLT